MSRGGVKNLSGGVWLPLTVEAGNTYTLSVSFSRPNSGTWVGGGFSGGRPTDNVNHANNQGRGWVATYTSSLKAYLGPGDTISKSVTTISVSNQPITQTITLNALSSTPADWTFTIIQDVSGTLYQPYVNANAGLTDATDITAIGLSGNTASGTFTNLTLTKVSAVPEPATCVLAAVGAACGGVAFAWRRGTGGDRAACRGRRRGVATKPPLAA